MTKFTKENISDDGMYLMYKEGERKDWKFIASFKHSKDGKGSFKTFLIKNFTVEEYFAEMDKQRGPLKILMEKGYLLPHMKRWCKEAGLPATKEGYATYIKTVWEPAMERNMERYRQEQQKAKAAA